MEIRVEAAEGYGLLPSAFVSVKVAGVVKQGRYDPNRRYNFPPTERRQNVRIDVYQHVGTCVVPVDPDAKALHEVKVAANDTSGSALRLKVNTLSYGGGATKEIDTVKSMSPKTADYLLEHNVEARLAEALKALLKTRPSSPIEFLCDYLRSNGAPPVQLAPEAGRPCVIEGRVETATNCEPRVRIEPQSCRDVDNLRQQARNTLMQACCDGTLTAVLSEALGSTTNHMQPAVTTPTDTGEPHVNADPQPATTTTAGNNGDPKLNSDAQLAAASPSGDTRDLEESAGAQLAAAPPAEDIEPRTNHADAADVIPSADEVRGPSAGEASAELQAVPADLTDLRVKAACLLVQACDDGTLMHTLDRVLNEESSERTSTVCAAEAAPVDEVREQIANMLLQASQDGRLESVLSGIAPGGANSKHVAETRCTA